MMETLDTAEFKQKIFNYDLNQDWKFEGDLPTIIEFYADWCPPCKMVAPILHSISKEYEGKLRVYKMDTDKEVEIAQTFGIMNLPTIMFIPKEGNPQISVGALPKPSIVRAINEVMKV